MKSLISPLVGVLQIFLLIILVDSLELVPDACSPISIVCVGEGESCLYDQYNGENRCKVFKDFLSVCRVCRDLSLTCHAGYCIKNIGTLGTTCQERKYDDDDSAASVLPPSNLYCRNGLSCRNSKCEVQSQTDENLQRAMEERGRGEACGDENTRCVPNLSCDLSRKCAWPVCKGSGNCKDHTIEETCLADPDNCQWDGPESDFTVSDANRYFYCETLKDCHFGEYCNMNRCLPAIPIGERLGAPCINVPGHCGEGMVCEVENSKETNINFRTQVCKWAKWDNENQILTNQAATYLGKEGEMCNNNADCGMNLLCDTTCTKPDEFFVGEGCQSSSECGRGQVCSCPTYGDPNGGRKRCIINTAYTEHNKEIEIQQKYRNYINCITFNKCNLERCKQQHCKELYEAMMNPRVDVCSLSQDVAKYVVSYLGASSNTQSSMFLLWSVTAFLHFFISF